MYDVELTIKEISEIKQLAKDTRKSFGVNDEVPIANDMKMLLDRQGIYLCEYPFENNSKIDAEIVRFETVDKPLIFIGLNSSLYYDEQIFALAHEIFHFKTKSGKAYSLEKDDEYARTEKKADRFAAELLLPETVLRTYVINEFSNESISDDNVLRILRFIANLQVVWWLPYKSIVLRLREEKLIDEELFNKLYEDFDVRDENSEYYTILKAIDKNAAIRLNNPTGNLTVSNEVIRTILKNYDDEYISEDEFVELLGVFKLEPSDYGYQIGDFDADCDIEGE